MLAAAKSVKDAAKKQKKQISVVVWFDSFRIYPTKPSLNPDAKNSAGISCMNSRAAHFVRTACGHPPKLTSAQH